MAEPQAAGSRFSRYVFAAISTLVISLAIQPGWMNDDAHGQDARHSYPLIGWQFFDPPLESPDFFRRFDLLVTKLADVQFARELKRLNPDILIVSTNDWNSMRDLSNVPDEWWLRDSKGKKLNSYGSLGMANLSDMCPRAKSGPYQGMRAVDYLPIFLANRVDLGVFDGVGTNGVWGRDGMFWKWKRRDPWPDIDANANGKNDFDEFSSDAWLDRWQAGIDVLMNELRRRIGPDKLLIINSGTQHNWGWDVANGIIDEKLTSYANTSFDRSYYRKIHGQVSDAGRVAVSVADGRPYGSNPLGTRITKDSFKEMRFGLVTSMFNDVYFSFQDLRANEHYWSFWYDEFDVDLGKPTGDAREVRSGVWVRFFDKGAAIANTDGSKKTVTDSDLRGVPGYRGPYYRFRGGQDPAHNHGKQFDRIDLDGAVVSNAPKRIFGEGIVLVRQPRVVVSDIIVDNDDSGTSPASKQAALSSGMRQSERCGEDAYAVRCSPRHAYKSYAYAEGSGSATFRPSIGLPGKYSVYEYHPRGQQSRSTYKIRHAGGTETVVVDQTRSSGRWNLLGTFDFAAGMGGFVEISGSNIVADAIMFRYGEGQEPPTADLPPSRPDGLQVRLLKN